jgi:AcrR family transcriptional regulator
MQEAAVQKRAARPPKRLSHNRAGQRLGRKGRDTRERILAAAAALIADPDSGPITLSAVAREASVGMTAIYNYFNDFSALLIALLEPVMASAEEGYLKKLQAPWPDQDLAQCCAEYVLSYYGFWKQHSRLLHLRNTFADQFDLPITRHRVAAAMPAIALITQQMGHDPEARGAPAQSMATALYMGMERAFTVATNEPLQKVFPTEFAVDVENMLRAQSRLLELGIRDIRSRR